MSDETAELGVRYEDSSLGAALHNKIQEVSSRCVPNDPRMQRLLATGERRIINSLAGASLAHPVLSVSARSVPSLFTHVYEKQDLSDYVEHSGKPYRSLNVTVPVEINPGANNLLWVHNCTSLIHASLEAGASAPWPAATLKTALDVEFNASQASHFTLVHGVYESPLVKAMEDPSSRDHLAAMLALWQLYASDSSRAERGGYLLRTLDTWYAVDLIGLARQVRGNVRFEGGGNWIVGSVNSTIGADSDLESQIRATGYMIHAVPQAYGTPSERYGTYTRMRGISDIVNLFRGAESYADAEEAEFRFLIPGDQAEQRHRQKVPGVPQNLCEAGWSEGQQARLSGDDPGRATLVGTTWSPEGSVCTFTVRYERTAPLPQDRFRINYEIPSASSVMTSDGVQHLILEASAVVATVDEPRLNPVGSEVVATMLRDRQSHVVRARVPFRVEAPTVVVNRERFGRDGRQASQAVPLVCGNWARGTAEAWVVPDGQHFALEIEAQIPATTKVEELPAVRHCQVETSWRVPRGATRFFPSRILKAFFDLPALPEADVSITEGQN